MEMKVGGGELLVVGRREVVMLVMLVVLVGVRRVVGGTGGHGVLGRRTGLTHDIIYLML